MPSYQENKSPAGQGRGEVTYRSDTPPPFDKWFLLEWEFSDDPSSITIWIDGEKLIDTMNGEKVNTVKFAWPKGSATVTGLVGGYQEFGFGARILASAKDVSPSCRLVREETAWSLVAGPTSSTT